MLQAPVAVRIAIVSEGFDSAPSVLPWKLLSHDAMPSRPVAERASLIAASMASAPLLANVT